MSHTLLLADDSVTIQRVIELTFADEDIRVVAVGDGQQAIERIESDRPDIVLADVGMPNRDGYEVAAHVKRTPHLSHIPVLLLTGAFEPVDEARASAAGCDGVLAKPFEPQMVINRVKELLSGTGPRPQERRAVSPQPPARVEPAPPAPKPVAPVDVRGAEVPPRREPEPGEFRLDVSQVPKPDATRTPTPSSPTPALSLDEYFDRLDAAFGGSGVVAPALQSLDEDLAADRFADSLKATQVTAEPHPAREIAPRRDAPTVAEALRADAPGAEAPRVEARRPLAQAAKPVSSTASEPRREPAAPPSPPVPVLVPPATPSEPPLAGAFSTLLAAERGEVIPSSARMPLRSLFPSLSASNDDLIEQIARRVLDRLADRQFVSDIVVRVTERVVREEIDRLRSTLFDK
ncbi:MAG: response regulator [Acidobacteria bacterium]|nr:response regulator [Acidobacteriota bacterium]